MHTVFEQEWGIPIPPPGTLPAEQHPNVLVLLARPLILDTGGALILPLFTTREKAAAYKLLREHPDFEIADLPVSDAVMGYRAVSFALTGIDENKPSNVDHVDVVIDPETTDWTNIQTTGHVKIPLDTDALEKAGIYPASLTITGPQDRLWMYRAKPTPFKVR